MDFIKFHIIFLFLAWTPSLSQEFINYTLKDGLPSNHVYRLTQDREGFIWAVTDKGIAKFNGKSFKVFNTRNGLPTNDIWDMRVDADNKIWFFSKTSFLGYIENDVVHTFPNCLGDRVMFPESINVYGSSVVLGKGNEWYFLKEGCWRRYIPSVNGQAQEVDFRSLHDKAIKLSQAPFFKKKSNTRFRSQDSLMFIRYNEGYSVVNLRNGKTFHKNLKKFSENHNPHYLRNHFVNGQIQFTGFDGVGVLDSAYEMTEVIKIPSSLKSHFSIVDRTGNIWCATFSHGIFMLPQSRRQCSYLLSGQKVDRVDKVGNRIIATVNNKGFYEYDPLQKSFRICQEDKGFVFRAVYIDSLRSTFFCSENRIVQIRDDGDGTEIIDRFKKIGGVRKLVYNKGFLFGNTSAGVLKIDPKTYETIEMFGHYGVRDLLAFQNNLVIATSDGLKIIRGRKIVPLRKVDTFFKKPILDLTVLSDSALLVNTDGYGSFITNLKTVHPLPNSEYLSVEFAYADNGYIWLATERGVLRYKIEGSAYQFLGIMNENDGLPSQKVNAVLPVGKDLLVTTDEGITLVPAQREKRSQLLKIYFEGVTYNNVPISFTKPEMEYTANNSVDFNLATIDLSTVPGEMEYAYRLRPLQQQWTTTTASSLNFSNLQPGNYTLQVKAEDQKVSTALTILPLWWQTSVAKFGFWAGGILMVGGVFFYYKNREIARKTARISAQKKMAEYELYALRAQMNPHFVFNSLAAIQYYINNNDFETSEKYLVKFSKLIRQFFELSKESEIPLETEIKLLKNYLAIEKLRFREKLDYEIRVDPNLDLHKTTIPAMLLQPIVENAVNHGIFNKENRGHVHLNFSKTDAQSFKVEIVDDGVGFAKAKTRPNGKVSSSDVLAHRIAVLNGAKTWNIHCSHDEVYPGMEDVGNITIFKFKKS